MPNPLLRDAVRSLRATPGVTAVALLSLALGIGANTALFSILNGLVLRPLPVREPDRLVLVGRTSWTNPIWEQIRDRQFELFDGACAWSFQRFDLSGAGRADPIDGAYVSGGLFRTLGVGTVAGRPLTASDDVRGGGPDGYVAVIGYGFWQRRFGGAPDAVGRRIALNRVPFTIVGVAPAGFQGPEVGQAMEVFVPLASEAAIRRGESALDGRSSWWLEVMARLKPQQTPEAGTAALSALRPAIRDATMPREFNAEYRARYLSDDRDFALVEAATGSSPLRARFARPLTIVMIVVAAVLLIACANIANLMLARAAARRHEMSVRLALGASRARLRCQMLLESLLLALTGAMGGVAVARIAAPLLVRQLGSDASSVTLDLSIDWRVLAFTAVVALGSTVLFGLAPAFSLGAVEPNDALKEQSRTVAGDRRLGLRNVLIVAQVALSLVLVAGAGLFVRTFTALATTPLGFDPERLLIVTVDASRSAVPPEMRAELALRVADAAKVPGVSVTALSFLTPMSGRNWTYRVQVGGGPTLSGAEQVTWVNAVAPGWFDTYGIRLLAGRDFTPSDATSGERAVIVNEAFVRRFAGPGSPLGQRVKGTGLGSFEESVIVGVVSDSVYRNARIGVVPTMYLTMTQEYHLNSGFSITARLVSDRQSVERALTDAIGRTDPNLAFSFRDYTDQLRATLAQERLVAMLSGFFGALAILLAALGLYGVTSYAVGLRRSEIAVRMALGASGAGVVRLVLGRVAALVALGTIVGVALSLWTARFVAALLFGVEARDPIMLTAAAVALGGVGMFAGWLPARRASRLAVRDLRGQILN